MPIFMETRMLPLHPPTQYINFVSSKVKPFLSFTSSSKFLSFCTFCLSPNNDSAQTPRTRTRSVISKGSKASDAAALKENWLDSLSCPFPDSNGCGLEHTRSNSGSNWVIGIDPDLSGALALLTPFHAGWSAQVFDSPCLPVQVGKRVRKRLDARSMVHLVRSLEAPIGTTAYIEQSIPYPQDGKQGWWSGGFGYGLWIGILVASGFSVVPVPSLTWKSAFELSGGRSTKDDSRRVASALYPSLADLLKRKKDHGRAEALLIASYGKGQKIKLESSPVLEELVP